MSRSWIAVRTEKEEIDRGNGRDVAEARSTARARTDAYVLGSRLSQLRDGAGLTQRELAARMGVSQARISQMEHGDLGQMELDTVRRYVAALGGRLRLVANFDDHDVDVSGRDVDPASA